MQLPFRRSSLTGTITFSFFMKRSLLSLFAAILYYSLHGQGFIMPLSDFPASQECYVIKGDGTRIEGTIKSVSLMTGITSVNLQNKEGIRVKLDASDIKEFGVKATGLVKMELLAESTETVKKMTKADFSEIAGREYIIYQQVLLPGKKDKYALLQLLNPGFDSKIKVFQDPNAQQTKGLTFGDAQLSGGEDKSYLFVKNGEQAILVKKGSYKKDFQRLFGDCSRMMNAYNDGEKLKFKNAAEHVWVYDKACSTETTSGENTYE